MEPSSSAPAPAIEMSTQDQLGQLLSTAVRSALGCPQDERLVFIGTHLLAAIEKRPYPLQTPFSPVSPDALRAEVRELEAGLTLALNASRGGPDDELIRRFATRLMGTPAAAAPAPTLAPAPAAAPAAAPSEAPASTAPAEASTAPTETVEFSCSGMGWGDSEMSKLVLGLEGTLDMDSLHSLFAAMITKVLLDQGSHTECQTAHTASSPQPPLTTRHHRILLLRCSMPNHRTSPQSQ